MPIQVIDKIKQKNNGTFALMDAADIEMPDGKRLDEKAEEIAEMLEDVDDKLADAASKIPVFNLTELGLPAVPMTGESVSVVCDITEITEALNVGSIYVTLNLALTNTTAELKCIMSPEQIAGSVSCQHAISNTRCIYIMVMSNKITAYVEVIDDRILPEVSEADNDKIPMVVDGKWTAVTPNFGGSGTGGGEISGSVHWNDIIGKPFEDFVQENDLLPTMTADGFALDTSFGAYTPGYVAPAAFRLEEYEIYNVEWDGMFYTCNATAFELSGMRVVYIGNGTSVGQAGNGEPFMITYNETANNSQLFAATAEASHTVRVYQTSSAERLREEYLPMEAIKTYIDDYISEALGGDY